MRSCATETQSFGTGHRILGTETQSLDTEAQSCHRVATEPKSQMAGGRGKAVGASPHKSLDAFRQQMRIEVQEQSKVQASCPQVGQHLRFEDLMKMLDAFHLDDDLPLHDEVDL